jgi:hypothetical protein
MQLWQMDVMGGIRARRRGRRVAAHPDASVVGPAVQVCRRVQANGTIRLGARWLSVGRRLGGTEVEVRVAASLLQIA